VVSADIDSWARYTFASRLAALVGFTAPEATFPAR
jgi:hypothetical protein